MVSEMHPVSVDRDTGKIDFYVSVCAIILPTRQFGSKKENFPGLDSGRFSLKTMIFSCAGKDAA